MAIASHIQFPVTLPFPSVRRQTPRVTHLFFKTTRVKQQQLIRHRQLPILLIKAIEEEDKSGETTTTSEDGKLENPTQTELSELGSEIKKAMAERKEKEGDNNNNNNNNLLSGVAEEVREIEWPPFGKVLGITGVVLGVIAGSSVVLLTVNFVLAELSDKVFAGRGVQDFFS